MSDYQLKEAEEENYFTREQTFGTNEGFQVAAAVTGYDGNSTSIEDPTIGTIEFYIKEFGVNNKAGLTFTKMTTKPCNFNNVEGTNLDSPFYPTLQDSE